MPHRAKIETYPEGWRRGDGSLSLTATAPGFYYDDPNTGRIERSGFVAFVEDFKAAKDISDTYLSLLCAYSEKNYISETCVSNTV